jgi:hypothetical protein
MFRIGRVKIRWSTSNEHDSNVVLTTVGLLLAWGTQRLIFGSTSWFGSLLFVTVALVLWLRARKLADQIVASSAIPAASRPPDVTTFSANRGFVISAVLFAMLGLLTLGNHPFTAINLSAWFAALGLLLLSFSGSMRLRTLQQSWTLNPRNLRARIEQAVSDGTMTQEKADWLNEGLEKGFLDGPGFGFGPLNSAAHTATSIAPVVEKIAPSSPGQVLWTFNLSKLWMRVSWVGLGRMPRLAFWAWGLFALLLGIFAFTRLASVNNVDDTSAAEKVKSADLVVDELSLNGETIRIAYSDLDMGQVQDLFDHDTITLARGREANPMVLDFEFPTPRPITGLVMDFGRMDFVMRVQVYGIESTSPASYKGEYRQQPPIPHVDMTFVDGPKEVSRIYIEIEQINPPDEPHIHVREVLFKE